MNPESPAQPPTLQGCLNIIGFLNCCLLSGEHLGPNYEKQVADFIERLKSTLSTSSQTPPADEWNQEYPRDNRFNDPLAAQTPPSPEISKNCPACGSSNPKEREVIVKYVGFCEQRHQQLTACDDNFHNVVQTPPSETALDFSEQIRNICADAAAYEEYKAYKQICESNGRFCSATTPPDFRDGYQAALRSSGMGTPPTSQFIHNLADEIAGEVKYKSSAKRTIYEILAERLTSGMAKEPTK